MVRWGFKGLLGRVKSTHVQVNEKINYKNDTTNRKFEKNNNNCNKGLKKTQAKEEKYDELCGIEDKTPI